MSAAPPTPGHAAPSASRRRRLTRAFQAGRHRGSGKPRPCSAGRADAVTAGAAAWPGERGRHLPVHLGHQPRQASGRLLRSVTPDGTLDHTWIKNSSAPWTSWQPLSAQESTLAGFTGASAAVLDTSSSVELFARTASETIMHYYQLKKGTGGWGGGEQLPGANGVTGSPSVIPLSGGRLELFARLTDGSIGYEAQPHTGADRSLVQLEVDRRHRDQRAGSRGETMTAHPELFALAIATAALFYNHCLGVQVVGLAAAGARERVHRDAEPQPRTRTDGWRCSSAPLAGAPSIAWRRKRPAAGQWSGVELLGPRPARRARGEFWCRAGGWSCSPS